MKIIKYKKIRNKYRVYLDNDETIDLYENIILKYELLIKKNVDSSLLNKIRKDNDKENAYEISLNYISIKMRTKKEINKYLTKKNYDKSLIEDTIKRLEKNNLLNDELYIKSYISDKVNLSNDGPYKIKRYLLDNDLNEDLVNKYIHEIDEESLKEKLDRLIDKKIKTIKNCSGNVLKFKVMNYFINLGYDKKLIEDILSNKEIRNDGGEKEYQKLYNKYSKKYEGYELERIISQKLYQKGYDYNQIKKNIN